MKWRSLRVYFETRLGIYIIINSKTCGPRIDRTISVYFMTVWKMNDNKTRNPSHDKNTIHESLNRSHQSVESPVSDLRFVHGDISILIQNPNSDVKSHGLNRIKNLIYLISHQELWERVTKLFMCKKSHKFQMLHDGRTKSINSVNLYTLITPVSS